MFIKLNWLINVHKIIFLMVSLLIRKKKIFRHDEFFKNKFLKKFSNKFFQQFLKCKHKCILTLFLKLTWLISLHKIIFIIVSLLISKKNFSDTTNFSKINFFKKFFTSFYAIIFKLQGINVY